MPKPKFRLLAGPNGSGKTYVFKRFKKLGIIHTEIYVNADRIEKDIKKSNKFSFNAYRVKVSDKEFKDYIYQSTLYTGKIQNDDFVNHLNIRSGILRIDAHVQINSYHASFIASFLAQKLLVTKQSFAYETVMSHKSKIDLLQLAKQAGYKTYLYFVFADSLQTNVTRVQLRVMQDEHNVNEEIIRSRAPRTFELLPAAFAIADTAYIIDNSNEATSVFTKENNKITRTKVIPEIIQNAITEISKSS